MQTIERYGVVVLLLCAVSIGAVWMWEGDGAATKAAGRDPAPRTARAEDPVSTPAQAEPPVRSLERPRHDRDSVQGRQRAPLSLEKLGELRSAGGEWLDKAKDRLDAVVGADEPGGREGSAEAVPVVVRDEVPGPVAPIRTAAVREAEVPTPKESAPAGAAAQDVYVVQAGDTLSEISMQQLGTHKRWKEIVALNPGLDASRLRVGARLRMPAGGAAAPATKSPEQARAPRAAGDRQQVRVEPGDSLWSIAERSLGDGNRYHELVAQNPGLDPARLVVGQILNLPAGAEAPAGRPRSTTPETVAKATPKKGRVR